MSEEQAIALRDLVLDAARNMSDAQILDLADALYDARRDRREEARSFDLPDYPPRGLN